MNDRQSLRNDTVFEGVCQQKYELEKESERKLYM